MDSSSERRRYYVTPPHIGWSHTQHGPWCVTECRSWTLRDFIRPCCCLISNYRDTQLPSSTVISLGEKQDTIYQLERTIMDCLYWYTCIWDVCPSLTPSTEQTLRNTFGKYGFIRISTFLCHTVWSEQNLRSQGISQIKIYPNWQR